MATTLIATIEQAARTAEAGWKSLITGLGAAYIEDTGLIDNEYDANSWGGVFLYLPAQAAADQQRRVSETAGYTVGSGRLGWSASRPFGVNPSVGATYYATGYVPVHPMPGLPYSWEAAVNEALRLERYQDEVSFGVGDSSGTYEFDVSATVPGVVSEDDIRSVRLRTTITGTVYAYQDATKNGRYVKVDEDAGHIKVRLYPAPSTSETVLITTLRTAIEGDTLITADAASLAIPLDLAAAATRAQLFRRLNGFRSTSGKYKEELARAEADLAMVRHNAATAGAGA